MSFSTILSTNMAMSQDFEVYPSDQKGTELFKQCVNQHGDCAAATERTKRQV
jgi:hypothetical protein